MRPAWARAVVGGDIAGIVRILAGARPRPAAAGTQQVAPFQISSLADGRRRRRRLWLLAVSRMSVFGC
jgi:hypothetical protein